jgi:hypothetical protein
VVRGGHACLQHWGQTPEREGYIPQSGGEQGCQDGGTQRQGHVDSQALTRVYGARSRGTPHGL